MRQCLFSFFLYTTSDTFTDGTDAHIDFSKPGCRNIRVAPNLSKSDAVWFKQKAEVRPLTALTHTTLKIEGNLNLIQNYSRMSFPNTITSAISIILSLPSHNLR